MNIKHEASQKVIDLNINRVMWIDVLNNHTAEEWYPQFQAVKDDLKSKIKAIENQINKLRTV